MSHENTVTIKLSEYARLVENDPTDDAQEVLQILKYFIAHNDARFEWKEFNDTKSRAERLINRKWFKVRAQ